jgi:hypothetical protein
MRGFGKEWNLPCFVTGKPEDVACEDLKDNISGFVESKAAGKRVVALFDGLARLDWRPREPNWIQVKVGAVADRLPALERLYDLVRANGGVLTREIVAAARLA